MLYRVADLASRTGDVKVQRTTAALLPNLERIRQSRPDAGFGVSHFQFESGAGTQDKRMPKGFTQIRISPSIQRILSLTSKVFPPGSAPVTLPHQRGRPLEPYLLYPEPC